MLRLMWLAFWLITISQSSLGHSLKVITYNIRYDNPGDGVNQWRNRKEKVAALLKKWDGDLIGVQEALKNQMDDLVNALPQYSYFGVGRDDGKEEGEYSAILYKKDRLELIKSKTFWLSETMEVPGSKSWDAAITRIVTVAWFRDKSSGKTFLHLNTHFDHMGREARKQSALLVRKFVENLKEEERNLVILSGDFNSEQREEPYRLLVQKGKVMFFDSRPPSYPTATFCGFKVGEIKCRVIDYIFYSEPFKVLKYQVIDENDGQYYPSDHLPVFAELSF